MLRFLRAVCRKHSKLIILLSIIAFTIVLFKDDVASLKADHDRNVFRWRRFEEHRRRGAKDGLPGERGKAVNLTSHEQKDADVWLKNISYNIVASKKIALDRSLPDYRPGECANLTYPGDLGTASVVIIFYNEPLVSILRTVHSVVNRSPPELLEEVILVDDASTNEEFGPALEATLQATWPDGVARLIRSGKRQGLIRARLVGAAVAKGRVLVWLDAHMEVMDGWLEPLLSRILEDRRVLLSPVVHAISNKDLSLRPTSKQLEFIGGFGWNLGHIWETVPARDKKLRTSATQPYRTVTLIGCALAMDRDYFYETGAFDEGMDIWGAENVELPVRIWMCGGSVEYIPCSRVGHVYRDKFPYKFPGQVFTLSKNNVRFLEVWMDEFKHMYYNASQNKNKPNYGDISSRIALRKKLKCHSFKWFLQNVYPWKFIPYNETMYYGGQFRNNATRLCLDSMGKKEKDKFDVHLAWCDNKNKIDQIFYLSKYDEIRKEFQCIEEKNSKLTTTKCHDSNRDIIYKKHFWKYHKDTGLLRHTASGKCIDARDANSGQQAILAACDDTSPYQKWDLPGYNGHA